MGITTLTALLRVTCDFTTHTEDQIHVRTHEAAHTWQLLVFVIVIFTTPTH